MSTFPGLIEADCMSCATAKMERLGGLFEAMKHGWFMGHPSMYSKCGNKRCPCTAHHDNVCTGSNTPGQSGSWYSVRQYSTDQHPTTVPVGLSHPVSAVTCLPEVAEHDQP